MYIYIYVYIYIYIYTDTAKDMGHSYRKICIAYLLKYKNCCESAKCCISVSICTNGPKLFSHIYLILLPHPTTPSSHTYHNGV